MRFPEESYLDSNACRGSDFAREPLYTRNYRFNKLIIKPEIKSLEFTTLFNNQPPNPKLEVCVILPAKDEADHILHTLDSLRLQQDLQNNMMSRDVYEVLMLANNCSDDTYRLAVEYSKRFPDFNLHIAEAHFESENAHIGFVRKLLMDAASKRLRTINHLAGIIASTDGDTIVDSKWIATIILEIEGGVDAVGGKIDTTDDNLFCADYYRADEKYRTLLARVESIIDPAAHDPWPRHFQYFGANLALKHQVYDAIGGLPAKRFLEDSALHEALVRKDVKIRKSPDVIVRTSSRTSGRVEIGFSEQLRAWSEMKNGDHTQFVPAAGEMIALFRIRKRMRSLWEERKLNSKLHISDLLTLAFQLQLNSEWLKNEIENAQHFGELWHRVEKQLVGEAWYELYPKEDIFEAIRLLEEFIEKH